MLFLAGFNDSIEYTNTGQHGNADGLSLLPVTRDSETAEDSGEIFQMPQTDVLPVSVDMIRQAKRSCFIACVGRHKARVANKL